MRKNKIIFFMLTILLCLTALYACGGKDTAKENVFGGIQEISISHKAADYDFKQGVTCVDDDGKAVSFKVNASNVKFGTAGEYTITYSAGKSTQTAKVFIYGNPTISVAQAISLTYKQANSNVNLAGYVTALDTFGNSLTVNVDGAFSKNDTGALLQGKHTFLAQAEDTVGNTASLNVEVTVGAATGNLSFTSESVDLSNAYITLQSGDRSLVSVYAEGVQVDSDAYTANNGYTMLKPLFFKLMGVLDTTVYLNYDDCQAILSLNITDDEEILYNLDWDMDKSIYLSSETVSFPRARLSESSAQDGRFKYFLTKPNDARTEITYDSLDNLQNNQSYLYEIEIYKGAVLQTTLSQEFSVSNEQYYSQNFAQQRFINDAIIQRSPLHSYLTFEKQITAKDGTAKDGLIFHKPEANGTATDLSVNIYQNCVYINPSLIASAKDDGYTKLKISYFIDNIHYINTATWFLMYSTTNQDFKMSESYTAHWSASDAKWFSMEVDIKDLGDGLTYLLINYDRTLYISDILFTNRQLNIDFEVNFAQQEYQRYWIRNDSANSELSFVADPKGGDRNVLKFYKPNASGLELGSRANALYLDRALVHSAIRNGYTRVQLSFLTVKEPAAESTSGCMVIYRWNVDTNWGYLMRYNADASANWVSRTEDITEITSLETLFFNNYGTTLYIYGLTFLK